MIVAAFVHFYGITEMAMQRLQDGSCTEQLIQRSGIATYENALDELFRPY